MTKQEIIEQLERTIACERADLNTCVRFRSREETCEGCPHDHLPFTVVGDAVLNYLRAEGGEEYAEASDR